MQIGAFQRKCWHIAWPRLRNRRGTRSAILPDRDDAGRGHASRPEMSAAAGELSVVRRYRRRANADTARKRWRPS